MPDTAQERLEYVKAGADPYIRAQRLMEVLRAPGGCPWDREQTFETLKKFVLEESYEVVDAIDSGNRDDLCEELGDFVLQAVFLAELGREEGSFALDDVFDGIVNKMIERHPHVFATDDAETADEVLEAWEARRRKRNKTRFGGSIAQAMPALARAQQLGERAARLGFDWIDIDELKGHLQDELAEVTQAETVADDAERNAALTEEIGDVLFLLTNVCRFNDIDAEEALRLANDKFATRMTSVLNEVGDDAPPRKDNPDLWDSAWNNAKAGE